MRKNTVVLMVTLLTTIALLLSSCKSGCGCHGDPFGYQFEMEQGDCFVG